MAEIERALNTLSASTGNYLIPEVVDPVIRDYVAKATPLLQVVTRVPWPTQTYWIRKRTALPTASWAADGGSLPAASNSTYTRVAKTVTFLYTRGEVTGPLIAAAGGVVNALQEEIRVSSQAIAEKLTTDLMVGTGASDSITGFIPQVNTSVPGDEGGTTDASAAALTLAMIDKAIDDTQGECDVIITSRAVRRKINSLLQAQQRFVDRVEVGAGFRVLTYDGVPILTDLHWEPSSPYQMLFARRADMKLIVNQDFTFSPLAKTKDSEDYFIKGYFGAALEGRPVLLKNFTV
jgi:HK97 family phage major capsid protein